MASSKPFAKNFTSERSRANKVSRMAPCRMPKRDLPPTALPPWRGIFQIPLRHSPGNIDASAPLGYRRFIAHRSQCLRDTCELFKAQDMFRYAPDSAWDSKRQELRD